MQIRVALIPHVCFGQQSMILKNSLLFRSRRRTQYGLCNFASPGVNTGKACFVIGCWYIVYNLLVSMMPIFQVYAVCSKNLGTLWEDLGKVIEGEDEIEIGQVDCGVSKPVCSKVDIHSYPTFKVFYEGEEVAKYKGILCFTSSLYFCNSSILNQA